MHLSFFVKKKVLLVIESLTFHIPWLSIDTDIRNPDPDQTQIELDDMKMQGEDVWIIYSHQIK